MKVEEWNPIMSLTLSKKAAAIKAINDGFTKYTPAPYWLSYPEMIKMFDGIPVFVKGEKSNGYKVTVQQLEAVTTDKTKAVILNSPSNPTGMIYTREIQEKKIYV